MLAGLQFVNDFVRITHPAFTCLNSTIEILEKGMKLFKVNDKNTRTYVFCSNVFTLNLEHTSQFFFRVSIVYFEQVNVRCENISST